MLIPLSWLREFVEISIPAELLAEKLTNAGLEVARIHYIGLPQMQVEGVRMPASDHLVWDRQRLLLGAIHEVKPHPNADKLVLAMVEIGGGVIEQCVTGAPNLFAYKDSGPLPAPLWTAFAAEGAEVWDGHSETRKRMILKEKPLRGIPNRSMVCSDYELGLSDDHDGIILMHTQPRGARGEVFEAGAPLADVLGDIVFEIELTPNLARCYSVYGVAREVAALLDVPLTPPSFALLAEGAPIAGEVSLQIEQPEFNPRFTLALLRGTTIQPSPEWMQRRLKRVGQRPINNIVDVTNYITFEIGQPLHAFDYDKLKARAGGSAPTISTRFPKPGETLETLDGVQRTLEAHTILVCDTAGVLSLGGVIGGTETEITPETTTVLLEAASWNFINIRRTLQSQKVFTDAGTRFSRGVHPSQAILGLRRGIELMRQGSGGQIAQGVLDEYPLRPAPVHVRLPTASIERLLGIAFDSEQAAALLRRGGFTVEVAGAVLEVDVPDYRMDIGTGVVGQADLIEEIARIHGYETIPTTIISDETPAQHINRALADEEATRDVLVALGLREQISYRMTTPEREAQLVPPGAASALAAGGYVMLANPSSPDKSAMRHTLLVSLLENARSNARYQARQAVFEIGAVYFDQPAQLLPDEPRHLALLLTGPRQRVGWGGGDSAPMDFYDLKGVVEGLIAGLHLAARKLEYSRPAPAPTSEPADAPTPASSLCIEGASFHPGRSAVLSIDGQPVGLFGELHPRVSAAFGLAGVVLAAEFDLDRLLAFVDPLYRVRPLPTTPPILQDIALVVSAETPASAVEAVIRKVGGALLRDVRLFDVYTGASLGAGMKSLAFALSYGADDRTLTDTDAAKIQQKIVRVAERELGAKLRS